MRRLAVVSLNNNGLVGRVPDVCDTHLGYASDSQLERLELSENALTGAFPGDGLACAQHLRTLDASYNHLTGVLPDVWADSMHQLRVLRFNNNPHLTGSIPTAWFPPLGGDDDDLRRERRRIGERRRVPAGEPGRAGRHRLRLDRSFAREPRWRVLVSHAAAGREQAGGCGARFGDAAHAAARAEFEAKRAERSFAREPVRRARQQPADRGPGVERVHGRAPPVPDRGVPRAEGRGPERERPKGRSSFGAVL